MVPSKLETGLAGALALLLLIPRFGVFIENGFTLIGSCKIPPFALIALPEEEPTSSKFGYCIRVGFKVPGTPSLD